MTPTARPLVLPEFLGPRGSRSLQLVPQLAAFDLDKAKLQVPVAREGSVWRTALVNRLRVSGRYPVVTLLAPAGYGKTTLLTQWAARDERTFVWVSIDGDDNDPRILLGYLAAALSQAGRIDPSVLAGFGSRSRSTWPSVRRLTSALLGVTDPLVVILDDVHLLRSRECANIVAALAKHVPNGSTLVLAGRALPRLPIARLRAAGRLLELGVGELALSRREAGQLLRGVGVDLPASDVGELANRTEGWAAGLYLAALSRKRVATSDPPTELGEDRDVVDYLRLEHLSRLGRRDVDFLTRTAVLDRMCGPLCDAVLGREGSIRKLESLERANLFLVPLDRGRVWFRYHHEFRHFLRAELDRREPGLAPALNRRAASWCEAHVDPEAAITYAHAAGDADSVARLLGALTLSVWSSGRAETVETWLAWFGDETVRAQYPPIGVLGAWVHALRGRPATAERWLNIAEGGASEGPLPDGSASLRPWIVVLHAAMCRDGAEQMLSDVEVAMCELGAASRWRPVALFLRGAGHLLLGEADLAEASMADAAQAAEGVGATDIQIVALAEQSLLAAARDEAESEDLARQARVLVHERRLESYVTSAIALAASARRELKEGNLERARAELQNAQALRPQLTHALPWYAVQTSLELAEVHLSILDVAGARAWLAHADEILRRRAALGALIARRAELGEQVERVAAAQEGRASTLTVAETRLLPLLATYLSFREIGEHLFISRNTVKTQAISVYRKLGVSSRSEAIERAGELGLVDRAS